MSNQTRAFVIGMLGPGVSAFGLLWMLAKSLLMDAPQSATFRYLLFDPPHLMVAVGVCVSALCLPMAIAVALAEPEDVEIPLFDAELEAEPAGDPASQPAQPYGWLPE